MYSMTKTATLNGIESIPIKVEVDVSTGMPIFDMVGYLSAEVREAKERVKTALNNSGISLPARRITINLAPADVRKTGTGFDLPIAVGLLISLGILEQDKCDEYLIVGELNLKGEILPIRGILPMVEDGKRRGITKFIVPIENHAEASMITGVEIFSFENILSVIDFLKDDIYSQEKISNLYEVKREYQKDFSDVNGQVFLKRACEVAASGMHNLLMIGPPGAGKTMIAERMGTILPLMDEEERMELSKIYSVCGLLDRDKPLIYERPFRNPHHTISKAGLIGGGLSLMPGEISLSHNGILFLDELTEFQKGTIEVLRQPIEEGRIHLTRGNKSTSYPADFLFLAAMNPCNCGYYPDIQKCNCNPSSIRRYIEKISQPLLDRIDICVEVGALSFKEITRKGDGESSDTIRGRVVRCHEIQRERFKDCSYKYNNQIPASNLSEYCKLNKEEQNYIEVMYSKLGLTARTYHKILRVARTIADLEESKEIKLKHLSEAVCYRSINDKYWGGV